MVLRMLCASWKLVMEEQIEGLSFRMIPKYPNSQVPRNRQERMTTWTNLCCGEKEGTWNSEGHLSSPWAQTFLLTSAVYVLRSCLKERATIFTHSQRTLITRRWRRFSWGSRVAHRSKALHLSAKGINTVTWFKSRLYHIWPWLGVP